MRYIAIIRDVDGLPRAYGMASTALAAEAEAKRQWAARIAARQAEGTLDRCDELGEMTVKPLAITSSYVEERVREIAEIDDDGERAHAREDDLHREVLAAIANGTCENAAECARLALTTTELKFPRWYA